jgi:UTP:GlnB (protein PII) uridylyltransferase
LSALDLDIVFAKVATEKNLALDIFSITNAAGRKLAEADLPLIEHAVRNALSESVNPVTPQAKSAETR